MKVTTKTLFEKAYGKFCIPAINISNPEQVITLFETAQEMASPFIVQTTPAARNYIHADMLLHYIQVAENRYPKVIYAIHLDHGYEEHIYDAINSNKYTSVMIDASHDEFEKNISRTRIIVEMAHKKNISVEAELGVLSGVEDDLNIQEENAQYTDPSQVEYFVKKTGCDSLAVAIGTSHGAYKFSGGNKGLRLDILEEIQDRMYGFPIVLHGASQIDKNEIKRINAAGGKIEETAKGISVQDIKKSISYGVCKLNIATDLRLLWVRVFREFFKEQPGEWDHLIAGKNYMNELKELLAKKFELLGSREKNYLYK